MFEEEPPEAKFWHTSVTGLYRRLPPRPRETELHKAARAKDIEKVRSMLHAGAPIDERSRDGGYTPLQIAAARGAVEIVQLLIDSGAVVDARDFAQETALHSAARGGSTNVVELLLSRGTDVNARSTNGATPLSEAAGEGHMAVVELLLAKGADINLGDRKSVV